MNSSPSSTDSNDDACGVALRSRAFAGVASSCTVVVENIADVAALDHVATGFSNKLLNLIEQQVIELLPGQRIPCFEPLDIFLGQCNADVMTFG